MSNGRTISAYPPLLATEVRRRWQENGYPSGYLIDQDDLEFVLDTAYQTSLLHEEGTPIRLRMTVATAAQLKALVRDRKLDGAILQFDSPLALTPTELQKLSGAAGYYRTIVAIDPQVNPSPKIWGMVLTGTHWVNNVEGGRQEGVPLPPIPIVHVQGPGHLLVTAGQQRVLETLRGELLAEGFDPFHSKWLPKRFATTRLSLLAELAVDADGTGPRICDSFVKQAAQSVVRRVLSLVRRARHGGLLLYLPSEVETDGTSLEWLRFRVRCEAFGASVRFQDLLRAVLQRLFELAKQQRLTFVTWREYQSLQDGQLAELDEALIDYAHFLADLMTVDGALVLDYRFRVLGFGAEIIGGTPVRTIHRALDLEGVEGAAERADLAGTRHRSAYRIVQGIPEAIAVVVSQDGGIRFVAQHNERLTYWPYLP